MTKKQIRILIITFIVIFFIVFIVFLLTNSGDKVNDDKVVIKNVNNLNNVNDDSKLDPEIIEEPIIKEKKVDATNLKVKSVAKNFAERYGTWSTDNKEENFKSVKVYTTSKMENIIEDFISNNDKLDDDYNRYYGITSKALNVKIINLEAENASLSVSVQQLETLGENLDKNVSYKNLNLELIKYNDDWFVDNAEWKD